MKLFQSLLLLFFFCSHVCAQENPFEKKLNQIAHDQTNNHARKTLDFIFKSRKLSAKETVYWHCKYAELLNQSQQSDLALTHIVKGLKLNQQVKSPYYEAYLQRLYGNSFYLIGQRNEAVNHYLEAIAISKKNGLANELAASASNVGGMYTELKEFEKAEKYLLLSIKTFEEAKLYNERFRAYRVLSSLYIDWGKPQKASSIFSILLKKKEFSDSALVSSAYSYLAYHYLTINKIDSSKYAIQRAFDYLKNTRDSLALETALGIKVNIYEKIGDYKTAFLSNKEHTLLRERIDKIAQEKHLQELNILFQTEKKEQELLSTKKQTKALLFIAILGGLVLILIGLFSYWRIKIKQRVRAEIEKIKQEQELALTKEIERQRIARELHDNIGSSISYITKKTEAILEEGETIDKVKQDLQDVKESAQEVMGGLRETLWVLNAKEITNLDLVDKLKIYIRKHALIPYRIDDLIQNEHSLSNESALALFRCSQEIINNCNKHSNASNLIIYFNAAENICINLIFEDNGQGFNVSEKEGHFGLKNLKSRLEEIGASLKISSQLSKGTRYEITLFL